MRNQDLARKKRAAAVRRKSARESVRNSARKSKGAAFSAFSFLPPVQPENLKNQGANKPGQAEKAKAGKAGKTKKKG
jgi:hypothetical protein